MLSNIVYKSRQSIQCWLKDSFTYLKFQFNLVKGCLSQSILGNIRVGTNLRIESCTPGIAICAANDVGRRCRGNSGSARAKCRTLSCQGGSRREGSDTTSHEQFPPFGKAKPREFDANLKARLDPDFVVA